MVQFPQFLNYTVLFNLINLYLFHARFGQHRNPPHPTIEEELLKAFRSAGLIAPEWYERPQQAYFQRASRTDKGVSAIKMVISLRIGKYAKF